MLLNSAGRPLIAGRKAYIAWFLLIGFSLAAMSVSSVYGDVPALGSGENPNGLTRHVLQHDGVEREYLVYTPPSLAGEKLPLLLALHGYGTTASGFAAIYGLNEHASATGYRVAYPQGSHFMGGFGESPQTNDYLVTSWNDLGSNFTPSAKGPHCTDDRLKYPCPPECGSCNHCAWTSCYDDVGFLGQVLNQAEADYPTDNSRVYILGVSNGAMMAMRLACNMPERFAAAVALIATMPPGFECAPTISLPLLHLAGARDDTVGYDGTATSAGWIFASSEDTQAIWAEGMGCSGTVAPWQTALTDTQGLQCTSFGGCPTKGHEVVSCLDPEAGHEWRGQRDQNIPANCSYPMQADTFPDQPACAPYSLEQAPWGMDLAWGFLSRY
ncbi:MAG: hypothetical protein V7720_10765 [Halioglobus sp.]